ncbi:response regulator [Candidatus Nitrosotenuis aquarius]|uniref:response regulator n=1 Tax=Candidatus Nitrosotenuis aquarius TaxID=1846278 RepID=UPI0013C337E7|nr:response regulator [Candidatus Nitrosotenuis aquarius]
MSLNILVAEDNAFTASQYTKILEKNGHRVQIAKDGVECIETYEKALSEFDSLDQNPFDVVLLDNNMPRKSGVEVAKEILDKRPNQRIIFASAYDINSLIKAPGDMPKSVEVLEKPFSLNTMISKLQS